MAPKTHAELAAEAKAKIEAEAKVKIETKAILMDIRTKVKELAEATMEVVSEARGVVGATLDIAQQLNGRIRIVKKTHFFGIFGRNETLFEFNRTVVDEADRYIRDCHAGDTIKAKLTHILDSCYTRATNRVIAEQAAGRSAMAEIVEMDHVARELSTLKDKLLDKLTALELIVAAAVNEATKAKGLVTRVLPQGASVDDVAIDTRIAAAMEKMQEAEKDVRDLVDAISELMLVTKISWEEIHLSNPVDISYPHFFWGACCGCMSVAHRDVDLESPGEVRKMREILLNVAGPLETRAIRAANVGIYTSYTTAFLVSMLEIIRTAVSEAKGDHPSDPTSFNIAMHYVMVAIPIIAAFIYKITEEVRKEAEKNRLQVSKDLDRLKLFFPSPQSLPTPASLQPPSH